MDGPNFIFASSKSMLYNGLSIPNVSAFSSFSIESAGVNWNKTGFVLRFRSFFCLRQYQVSVIVHSIAKPATMVIEQITTQSLTRPETKKPRLAQLKWKRYKFLKDAFDMMPFKGSQNNCYHLFSFTTTLHLLLSNIDELNIVKMVCKM